MIRAITLLATAAALALTASAAPAQTMDFELGVSDSNGVCGVELPGENGIKIEFSVRADNGNLNVAVHNIDAAIVDAGLDADRTPQLTLAFDTGQRFAPDLGAYRAGFTYRVLGAWSDPAAGHPALTALKTAGAVTVSVDGASYGPISTQQPGLAWQMLADCMGRNGGTMPA